LLLASSEDGSPSNYLRCGELADQDAGLDFEYSTSPTFSYRLAFLVANIRHECTGGAGILKS
jgi:hypothetical protein